MNNNPNHIKSKLQFKIALTYFSNGAMIRDVSPNIEDINLESRSAEKEKTLKLIEQKLKSYEEKKEQEDSNQPQAVKKKGHFWSDCKVE